MRKARALELMVTLGCFAFSLNAQMLTQNIATIKTGLRFGGGLSQFREVGDIDSVLYRKNDDKLQWNTLTQQQGGLYFSGAIEIMYWKWFGIRPEVAYATRGAKSQEEGNVQLHNIAIPVSIKLKIPRDWVVEPNIFFGPELDILLMAYANLAGETSELSENHFNTLDFALFGGGGLDVNIGNYSIIMEAKYSMGFLPTGKAKIGRTSEFTDLDAKSSSLTFILGLGYSYGNLKK
ncbi:MAG: outer membrane beta-barrel protein [Chitinivibrionales bacterium]|nr:outer membrane beta-barrel protein [Chitinivibrionales bacterium]